MATKDHVAVRLDDATLSRVDALKDVLTTEWHEATRSDILRALILIGLERFEQEYGGSRNKPRKVAAQRAPKARARRRG